MLKVFSRFVLVYLLTTTLFISQVYAQPGNSSQGVNLRGVSDDNILSSIVMLGIGVVATRLYKYQMTTDTTIAAAGGVAYVYGEFSSLNKFQNLKDDLQVELGALAGASKNEAQVDYIRGLKKSYKEASDILKTKRTLQLAASAAFATAGFAAYSMKELEIKLFLQCWESMRVAKQSCYASTNPTGLYAGQDQYHKDAYEKLLKVSVLRDFLVPSLKGASEVERARVAFFNSHSIFRGDLLMRIIMPAATPPVLNPACQSISDKMSDACLPLKLGLKGNEVSGSTNAFRDVPIATFSSMDVKENQLLKSNNLNNLINLFLPKAEAGAIGLGGAAAGILIAKVVPAIGSFVDKYLLTPDKRMIVYGMLSTLSLISSQLTQDEINKMDANIKKIDKLLSINQRKKNLFENVLDIFTPEVYADSADAKSGATIQKITDVNAKAPCIIGTGTGNCPSLTSHLNSTLGLKNLSPAFKNIAFQVTTLADELNGKKSTSPKAQALIDDLSSKSLAINKSFLKVQMRNGLKLKGSTQHNVYKQAQLLDKLNSITAKTLKKHGVSPAELLASYGGSALPASRTDAASAPVAEDLKMKGVVSAANSVAITKEARGETEVAKTEKVDNYNFNKNDINTNKDDSIFTIISNRYLKSAFPSLIEK